MTETDACSEELKRISKVKDRLEGLCRALQEERKILTKTLAVIEKRLFKHFGESAGRTLLEADVLDEENDSRYMESPSVMDGKNGYFKNKDGKIESIGIDLQNDLGYDSTLESDEEEEEEEEENIMEQPYI